MDTIIYACIEPSCTKTFSIVRIFSDYLQPNEVTQLLELKPTQAYGKGQKIGKTDRRCKLTGWFFSTEKLVQSKDTGRHIDKIISTLVDRREALNHLATVGCKIDIMNYWLSPEPDVPLIDHDQVKHLAELGIEVWWDVHIDNQDRKAS